MKKYGKLVTKKKYSFFHKRQLVQKILLNSLYGVLGLPLDSTILIMIKLQPQVKL